MINIIIILAFTTSQINAQQFACNPANWCHPQSMLCKSSEAISAIAAGRDPPNIDTSRGVCTDAYRWVCNKAGFNCKRYDYSPNDAFSRCSEIMNPSKKNNLFPGQYIEACREGEFTCRNGYCATSSSHCSSRGGVKYGIARCAKDSCGSQNVLTDICEMGSTSTEGAFECLDQDLAQVPPCCPEPNSPQCRYLELEGGSEVTFSQCGGECPDACLTDSPNSKPTTKAPTLSPTPPTSIIEYPPAGIVVKFEQKSEDRDCCCKISCDCFGDPHCTSFFGQQQTSKVSDGQFDMFRNLDIGVRLSLGPPQGIIEHIVVDTSEDSRKLRLSTSFCNNATHNWQDDATGKFIHNVPSNWDVSFSLDPEGVSGYTDPSLYNIRDKAGQILIQVKCQPFLWQINSDAKNPKYQRNTRIDIVVTAWRDKIVREGTNEVCCPSQAENEEWVVTTGASGYCVNPQATPIPGGIINPGRRRALQATKEHNNIPLLGFSHEKELSIMEKQLPKEFSEEQKFDRLLQSAQQICEEYLSKAGEEAIPSLDTIEECLQNIADFGLGSIASLIDLIDTEQKACISDPQDPRLPGPTGLKECEAGVILEVQKQGQGEWIAVQAFPAGLPYCNNQVLFDFSRIEISPGVFLGPKDRYRLKQCQPDSQRCGLCTPLIAIQDSGFSFVHECATYKQYKNFLKFDLLNGMKTGEFACGYKYFGNPDALACIKDNVSAFN